MPLYVLILSTLTGLIADGENPKMLPLGESLPLAELALPDAKGQEHSLAGLSEEQGLLVIFSCNTCPFVLAWEEQYPELYEKAQEMNLGMVLINSNAAKRKGEDSPEAMLEHAQEAGYPEIPYLVDRESKLANAMGAKTTPHVYLFNEDKILVYRGSINDKFENKNKEASHHYLLEALQAMQEGQAIEPATTRQIGCSIKRADT